MRVILDECVPRPLKRHVAGHDVTTVQERGWAGLKNGPLLRLMREARVEAFVTTDRNLEYQQNVAAAGFAVFVDFLMTWNSTHIANAELRPRVEQGCRVRQHQRLGRRYGRGGLAEARRGGV